MRKKITHERIIVGKREIMVEKSRVHDQFAKLTPGDYNVFSTGMNETKGKSRFAVVSKGERTVDGIEFASKLEKDRYNVLKQRERAGLIEKGSLERQPEFICVVNNVRICRYRADFCYRDAATKKTIWEDTKAEYVLKNDRDGTLRRKLVEALYSVKIDIVLRSGQ
jgi:hypothetical protein